MRKSCRNNKNIDCNNRDRNVIYSIAIRDLGAESNNAEKLKIKIIQILALIKKITIYQEAKEIEMVKSRVGFSRIKPPDLQKPEEVPTTALPVPKKPFTASSFRPETPPPSPGCKRPRTPDIFLSLDNDCDKECFGETTPPKSPEFGPYD